MHINLNNPSGNFSQLSPLFESIHRNSPYLSPLPNNNFRKYSNSNDDFMNFQLEGHHSLEQEGEEFLGEQFDDQLIEGQQQSQRNDYLLEDYNDKSMQELCKQEEVQEELQEPRCELQSTKFMEVKEEVQPPYFNLSMNENCSRVHLLIEYILENISKKDDLLLAESQKIIEDSEELNQIFHILVQKFKKLKKTKEEMTKYCMRKAFKFIADMMRRDRTHNRDVDSCMKLYFSKYHISHNFTIPFKKNSVEKTMNGNFLKRIFSSPNFVNDYREFLKQFRDLMIEDNDKKIKYLSDLVEELLAAKDIKKVETIKRLPWTRETLLQTEQLGMSLINFAETYEVNGKGVKRQDLQ